MMPSPPPPPAGGVKRGGRKKAVVVPQEDGDGDGEEAAALKAFAERNKEGALKTRPKGFIPEHRDMQLLRLKNFTVGRKVEDGVFTRARGQEEVERVVGDMVGFVSPPSSLTDLLLCCGRLTCVGLLLTCWLDYAP
jgi:hypothetical protein